MSRLLILLFFFSVAASGEDNKTRTSADSMSERINALEKPMYTPFVELYVLEELKQLRVDMAKQRHEMVQQIVDREHSAVDRAVTYSTDTVTYFFYLIAAASTVMVLIGWNSMREIKDQVHKVADEEVSDLVNEYEKRLKSIEQQLNQKTRHIQENKEEIELTQEIQSFWLKAGRDSNPATRIEIYDDILKLRNDDVEALTYKADAVLELGEPQWAANLCHQALKISPEDCHAFYQLGCAYTQMNQFEDAVKYLSRAIALRESYREDIISDPALLPLKGDPAYDALLTSIESFTYEAKGAKIPECEPS